MFAIVARPVLIAEHPIQDRDLVSNGDRFVPILRLEFLGRHHTLPYLFLCSHTLLTPPENIPTADLSRRDKLLH